MSELAQVNKHGHSTNREGVAREIPSLSLYEAPFMFAARS
jgi:hypothetical protein